MVGIVFFNQTVHQKLRIKPIRIIPHFFAVPKTVLEPFDFAPFADFVNFSSLLLCYFIDDNCFMKKDSKKEKKHKKNRKNTKISTLNRPKNHFSLKLFIRTSLNPSGLQVSVNPVSPGLILLPLIQDRISVIPDRLFEPSHRVIPQKHAHMALREIHPIVIPFIIKLLDPLWNVDRVHREFRHKHVSKRESVNTGLSGNIKIKLMIQFVQKLGSGSLIRSFLDSFKIIFAHKSIFSKKRQN